MKTIGLLGGMSWESSAVYYRLVNEAVRDRLGGLHSAPCVLHSVDFAPIEVMQREGRWDDAAEALATGARALERVGLLASAYTMEQDFYVGRLRDRHGLDVLIPEPAERAEVHRVIYEELCIGRVEDRSRERYRDVMDRLDGRGAEAILLGCTEIDLLIGPEDAAVPLFDTTRIHAERAVELALAP